MLLNKEKRKMNGITFTPEWVVEFMVDDVITKKLNDDVKILDVGCGLGVFTLKIAKKLQEVLDKDINNVIKENIFFIDKYKEFIEETSNKLKNIVGENINTNGVISDFLFYNNYNEFDIIIGNPPYIRVQNLEDSYREELQSRFYTAESGSFDYYFCFFEKALSLLKDDGILSFITPNSYFYSLTGENLRKMLKPHIKKIVDFDHFQVFDDTTYSCITTLSMEKSKEFDYCYINSSDLENIEFNKIIKDDLDDRRWEFLTEYDVEVLNDIKGDGTTLGNIADIHCGLATLRDSLYIMDNPEEDDNYFFFNNHKIEKDICKPIIKCSTYKGNPQNKYIIFPYRDGKIILEDEFEKKFPFAHRYFLSVKDELLKRDKGKTDNYPEWYAFGRSQGLINTFGKKIITSTMNIKPKFFVIEDEESTFYSGYCIKPKMKIDLYELCDILNSKDMEYYISKVSKSYRNGYKSYAKTFIKDFAHRKFNKIQKNLF